MLAPRCDDGEQGFMDGQRCGHIGLSASKLGGLV
jgi:hypothetical protein